MTSRYVSAEKQCGEWKCTREAKWQRSDLEITDPTDEEQQALAHQKTRCGVHGPGPEKRSHYGLKWGWSPVTVFALQALALRAKRVAALQKADAEQQEVKNHERRREIAKNYWARSDEEPDYEMRYEEETKWDGRLVRRWSIYSTADLERYAGLRAEHPEESLYSKASAVVDVEVQDDSPYPDVTYPVDLRIRASSNITPKLAPFYAKAILRAAEVVEAMNTRLRQKHNNEVKGA